MPERLIKIFNEMQTPSAERFRELEACMFQGESLEAAEEFPICDGSSRVPDSEGLARAMESPSHVKPVEMEFSGGAFLEATKRGISVQQVSKTSPQAIHEFGKNKVAAFNDGKPEEKKRTYLGYVVGLCSLFRDAKLPDNRRIFAVFSTPLPDTISHADIFVIVTPGREEKAAIQQVFWDAFDLKRLISPEA